MAKQRKTLSERITTILFEKGSCTKRELWQLVEVTGYRTTLVSIRSTLQRMTEKGEVFMMVGKGYVRYLLQTPYCRKKPIDKKPERKENVAMQRKQLLKEIESCLKLTGVSASAFGRKFFNDPGFVHDLRAGRSVTLKTMKRVTDVLRKLKK